ncbi:MAG: hypothetical protein RLZZ416_384 [Candidatus Parcubacteria bacterium]|jgi:F-type H+-transporting ATPase subunit b
MSDLLAVFGVNWKLLVVQAINFGVLLSILTYLLYKPLLRIIDERQRVIGDGVRTAQAAEQKLADAKRQSEAIVGDAARDAEGIIAQARSGAETKANEIVRAAEARAQAALKDAAERAEETHRQALIESERGIARAAMLAAEKILREKTS